MKTKNKHHDKLRQNHFSSDIYSINNWRRNANLTFIGCLILALIILLLVFGCGSRKTESTKEKENLQSLINLKSTSLNWDGFFSSNNTIVVEREKYLNGVISEKETKSINNQTQNKQSLKYNNFNIYKTITTYKTVYVKQTERVEAKNYWIVLCVLVISIVTAIYFYTKRPLG